MKFQEPYKVYTAESNVAAHLIANMLDANGIAALVDEDQSGVSLWALGRLSQYHQPNIWVEKATATRAAELIANYEQEQRDLKKLETAAGDLQVECEECGKTAAFPQALDGTTQECPHCHAYVDVGELDWDEDFGEAEN